MFWLVPTLFALSAGLLVYALLASLREAEESYVSEYTADTARQFEDLFLFIPPEQIMRLTHIAASVIFILVFMVSGNALTLLGVIRGGIAGILAAGLVYLIPRFVLGIMKRRRLERFNAQLATALDGMSNALKAGFSIQQAFDSVVDEGENPIAQEFAMFLQQLRVGMTFEDALADMDRRMGSEDLTLPANRRQPDRGVRPYIRNHSGTPPYRGQDQGADIAGTDSGACGQCHAVCFRCCHVFY